MGQKIVLALGGNALGKTPYEQQEKIKETVKPLVNLVEEGHQIIIVHGNGPQVGMVQIGMAEAAKAGHIPSDVPFPECGAMSQGYIGYHLQNALHNELKSRGLNKQVGTVLTQTMVDKEDPAFESPTKPIGSFYSEEEMKDRLSEDPSLDFVEDAGRGYRQVVPSPKPIDIIEKDLIKSLLDKDYIVIACGGGGVPVVEDQGQIQGVPAVIDKDFAAEKLAEILDADQLVILTAVDYVALNYGKADQTDLEELSLSQAQRYLNEGQFAKGSMLPKVEAAMAFVRQGQDKQAIIASLDKASLALEGKTGTRIISA